VQDPPKYPVAFPDGDPHGFFGTKVMDDRRLLAKFSDGKMNPVELKRTIE